MTRPSPRIMAIVAVTLILGSVSIAFAFRHVGKQPAAVNNCPAGQSHLSDGFGCVTIRQGGRTLIVSELRSPHVLQLANTIFVFRDEKAFTAASGAVTTKFPDPRALGPVLASGPAELELQVPELAAG